MKQKLLFLLTALMLLTTGNAWGDETIGDVDGGWADHHKTYTLAPNKSLTINFTVDETKNDADYQGWITNAYFGESMIFFMQPSCGYWGSGWDKWGTGATYNGNNYNWDGTNFRNNLQGASVVYNIKRVGNDIILTEDVTTTSTAPTPSTKFRHYFVFPYESNGDISIDFGADAAVLTIKDVTTTDATTPTTYGTLVGATNNTAGWWTVFSDYYSIGGDETKTLYFKNYSNKIANGNNWVLYLTDDADRGSCVEYLALRSDHYGWGSMYSKGTLTSNYDWNTFKDELDGANVKMNIVRSGSTVTVTATQIAATDGTTVRTETFTVTDDVFKSGTNRFFLTTEGGHLDILPEYTVTLASNNDSYGTTTKTTAFNDDVVPAGTPVTVTATSNDGYYFVNWTENDVEVSTNASYTYTALGNRSLVANFEVVPLIESITVNYTYNDEVVYSEAQSDIAGLYVGDSYNVPFRKYVMKGSTLYVSAKRGSDPYYGEPTTLTANTVVEKAVTPIDLGSGTVVLFEDLDNTTAQFAGIRASYCSAYDNRAYESAENLPAGNYDFIVYAQNKGRGSSVKVGETTVFGIDDVVSSKGSWTENTISNVNVPAAGKMTFVAGGSSTYDDYDIIIAVLKSVPATIGTNGYTTFASPYPLDLTKANLPSGVKAYKAQSINSTSIRFTEFDQTVPANTGMLLKGTSNAEVNIPVVASGDAVSENLFAVNEGNGYIDPSYEEATTEVYYFAMIKDSDPLTFGKFNPASYKYPSNKAYLTVAKNLQQARLTVSFGEEDGFTGINAVEAAEAEDGALKDGKYLIGNKVILVKNGVKYGANGQKLN